MKNLSVITLEKGFGAKFLYDDLKPGIDLWAKKMKSSSLQGL